MAGTFFLWALAGIGALTSLMVLFTLIFGAFVTFAAYRRGETPKPFERPRRAEGSPVPDVAEPTPEMIEAGLRALADSGIVDEALGADELVVARIYHAMLAASRVNPMTPVSVNNPR